MTPDVVVWLAVAAVLAANFGPAAGAVLIGRRWKP